jgi:hypothetical protein
MDYSIWAFISSLDQRLQALSPAYFAFVMATGIPTNCYQVLMIDQISRDNKFQRFVVD